jgi:hypothetical protein
MAGSWEQGNESSCSIKLGDLLNAMENIAIMESVP